MSEMLTSIYTLLMDVIVPHLKAIRVSQAEQKLQSESLSRSLEEFRASMQIHMAEIRAEIALCRQQLEDAMVLLSERESEETDAAASKKKIVH